MLRAIAHPLRGALIYELHARGASTATVLAAAVDAPVNSVSFHLRELAKYGLIERAPNATGDGRQRWWQPAGREGLHIDMKQMLQTREGRAAFDVFRRYGAGWWHALVDRFFGPHEEGTGELWAVNDVPMLLTKSEAAQYAEEMYAVMHRWVEHGQSTQPPEGEPRRTYLGLSMLMPHQTDLIS